MTATALQRPQRRPSSSAGKGFTPNSQRSPLSIAKEAYAREPPRNNSLKRGRNPEQSGKTEGGREKRKELPGHGGFGATLGSGASTMPSPRTRCRRWAAMSRAAHSPPALPSPGGHRSQLGSRARLVPRRPLT